MILSVVGTVSNWCMYLYSIYDLMFILRSMNIFLYIYDQTMSPFFAPDQAGVVSVSMSIARMGLCGQDGIGGEDGEKLKWLG